MTIASQVKSFCIIQFANTNSVASVQPQYHSRDRKTHGGASQFTLCVSIKQLQKKNGGNVQVDRTSLTRQCKVCRKPKSAAHESQLPEAAVS